MYVIVQTEAVLYTIVLPAHISGRFPVCDGEKQIGYIRAFENQWQLCADKNIRLLHKEQTVLLQENETYIMLHETSRILLFVKKKVDSVYVKYKCDEDFCIGRSSSCAIQLKNPYVSSVHVSLYKRNGKWYLKDSSSNHTYVNRIRCNEREIGIGDVIHILGFQMICGPDFLAWNEPSELIHVDTEVFQPYQSASSTPQRHMKKDVERVFRPAPVYKGKMLHIRPYEQTQTTESVPLFLKLGPALTMGIVSLCNVGWMLQGAIQNKRPMDTYMPSLLMSFSMMMSAFLFPVLIHVYQRKKDKHKESGARTAYSVYLTKKEAEIQRELKREERILNILYPAIQEIFQAKAYWYIHHQDENYRKLCFGYGEQLSSLQLHNENPDFDVSLKIHAPLTVDLSKTHIISVAGTFEQTQHFLEYLALHLACSHSPDLLQIIFAGKHLNPWLRWLPQLQHVHLRCWIQTEADAAAFSKTFSAHLENGQLPATVLFVEGEELLPHMPVIDHIKHQDYCGCNLIFLHTYTDVNAQLVIDLETHTFQYREDMERHPFEWEPFSNVKEMCQEMANMETEQKTADDLQLITFLSMYNCTFVEELNIWKRWEQHQSMYTLAAPIGLQESKETCFLDLHEKHDGPHGMIAGMTGSGKSECLLTYLLSMAVCYHPQDVQFLLIDYKGGGFAKLLEPLPHTAGIMTNLDDDMLIRTFSAIQNELLKRQNLLKETALRQQIANLSINDYQRLYYEGKTTIPLAHLLIVCDEFAELKMQHPEYLDQLISASRIGRSLGIHLLLATQKPAGIVNDQIWSNTHFHLCMKVAERSDSMDMIHRPDASELSKSGEFYLQIGNDEAFYKGQCAWTQALYEPYAEHYPCEVLRSITNIGTIDHEIHLQNTCQTRHTQFETVLKHILACASGKNLHSPSLWLPPLTIPKTLQELKDCYGWKEDQLLIGELDKPANCTYEGLYLDLNAHVLVVTSRDAHLLIKVVTHACKRQHVSCLYLDMQHPGSSHNTHTFYEEDAEKFYTILTKEWKKRTQKTEPSLYILIHRYSAIEKGSSKLQELLLHLLKEGGRTQIGCMVITNHEDEIPFRIRTSFTQSYALYMDSLEELNNLLHSSMKKHVPYLQGKGFVRNGELYEFLLADIRKEIESDT